MKSKNLPGLLIILLLLVVGCIVFAMVTPDRNHGMRARIVNTMADEKQIAAVLKQRAAEIGGMTNINSILVYQTAFDVLNLGRRSNSTNSQGEILDIWGMPFQIEIVPTTNFVVRSAGSNKKFNDDDDIVFNSVSNDFVKP